MHDFPGMIAAANGGTLFLDEISDMPPDLQTRFFARSPGTANIGRLAVRKQ